MKSGLAGKYSFILNVDGHEISEIQQRKDLNFSLTQSFHVWL